MTTNGSFGSSFGFTRRRLLALGAATSASAMFASPALAQLRLDVTQGNVAPIPMAIPDFIAGTPGDAEVARDELSRKMMNAQEADRTSIARDSLSPQLTTASYSSWRR